MQPFKKGNRILELTLLIFSGFLIFAFPAFANTASVNTNNSSPNADGQTVSVITIDVYNSSGSAVGAGDNITITNTNSDSGLNIVPNNNGACAGSTKTSAQAATGSDGSGTPGNEVQFGICSTNAGTDSFTISDSTGNLASISITFVAGAAPTFTPTPTPQGYCGDASPGSTPTLDSAVSSGNDQVTLTWTDALDPVTNYSIAYGVQSEKYTYGNTDVGGQGTTSYTVGYLNYGTTYYFVVAANNGCASGAYSNEVSATVGSSSSTNSTAATTSTANSQNDITLPTPLPTATPAPTPTPTPVPAKPLIGINLNGKTLVGGMVVGFGIVILAAAAFLIFRGEKSFGSFRTKRKISFNLKQKLDTDQKSGEDFQENLPGEDNGPAGEGDIDNIS